MFRYIDDVISVNNSKFDDFVDSQEKLCKAEQDCFGAPGTG
jgi:hypothetical protein